MEQPNTATMSDDELMEKLNPAPAPIPEPETAPTPKPETAPEPEGKSDETPAPEGDKEEIEEPEEEGKTDIKAENEQLKKQLAHLQQLYGRQANELGEARKQLKAKPTAQQFDEDPVAAAEQLQEHTKKQEEIAKMEQEQETRALAIRNMEFITSHAPDLKANAPVIREVLSKEDQASDEDIQQLYANIYLYNPWGVYQLNQRAKLYSENKKLKTEIEKLKKAPKETANKIAEISKTKSNVAASTGNSSEPLKPIASPGDLAGLNDDELKQRLKILMKGN